MLGFTKDEIIQRANDWIIKNQPWADSVVADAVAKAILPFRGHCITERRGAPT